MKKSYLFLTLCMGFNIVWGQKQYMDISTKNKNASFEQTAKKSVAETPKGITIWSNDFSNNNDWIYDNTSSPFLNWCLTSAADTIPVTALNPALFTSVGNGFAFINSDAQGQNGTQNANMTYTGMIDCSNYQNVSLVFEHSYRTYLDTRIVRISNDGGMTWTDFTITDGTEPTAQNTANPEIASLNVSAVAGGNDSVMIQLNYQGNWGWYWAVDDMKLVETDQYDLKLQKIDWGTDGAFGTRLAYYQVPTAQIAPINFGGIVQNIGVQNIGDAVFTANINALYSGLSSPSPINASEQDTLWCTATFTPNASNAVHSVSFDVSSSQPEVDVTNNSQPNIDINVNDFIYARDKGVILGGVYNAGNGFEAGPTYDIFQNATLYAIDGYINATSEIGSEVFAKLYYNNPTTGDFDFIDESLPYILTAADLGEKHTFALQTPQALTAGESYTVVVGSYGDGGVTNDLVIASSGGAPIQTVFYFDYTDQTWYYTSSQTMVRMNFDQASGIYENQEAIFELSPNPAQHEVTISFEANNNEKLGIFNLAGQTVCETILEGPHTTVSTSMLKDGVYFVQINGKGSQKLVVNH
ncbi:MAG: T9SS type A sorting domain-containing protein [Flavobacteriales bacterium]